MSDSLHIPNCRTILTACAWIVLPMLACFGQDATTGKNGQTDKSPAATVDQKPAQQKKPAGKSDGDQGSEKPKADKPERNKPDIAKSDTGKSDTGKPDAGKSVQNETKAAKQALDITPEREQAALDFAAENHPELVSLITPLKTSNPKEYTRAIRELYRTHDRLLGIKLRDEARYKLELDAWKLQSQVRLLAAQMLMASSPELEQQLKDALKKKAENQLQLWKSEKENLQKQLENVDKKIEISSRDQERLIQNEYDRLLKPGRDRAAVVPKANPAKAANKNAARAAAKKNDKPEKTTPTVNTEK